MTDPCIILFREDDTTEFEFITVNSIFSNVQTSRVIENSYDTNLVVARYSALPFYKELEEDLNIQGLNLINSYQQHKYIANFEYYWDLEDLTPKTYFRLEDIPEKGGPFVVKGVTNSRKFFWNDLMYATNKQRAIQVACDLQRDALLQNQDIIVRDYANLKILEKGVTGTPVTNEWRFFCLGSKILSEGFYWSCSEKKGKLNEAGIAVVQEVQKRVSAYTNFFVVDIAQLENGSWIVIELNDGQMSGLSENNPKVLYSNLKQELEMNNWRE